MKSAFFIMQMWQTGNIGSHNISKLKDNPKEGYSSCDEAKQAMLELWSKGNWELTKGYYTFSIMEVFSN